MATPLIVDCFLCRQTFRYGLGHYEGRGIEAWGIQVCDRCYNGNWGGIVLESHPDLRRHLEAKGINPKLNTRGWLPGPE